MPHRKTFRETRTVLMGCLRGQPGGRPLKCIYSTFTINSRSSRAKDIPSPPTAHTHRDDRVDAFAMTCAQHCSIFLSNLICCTTGFFLNRFPLSRCGNICSRQGTEMYASALQARRAMAAKTPTTMTVPEPSSESVFSHILNHHQPQCFRATSDTCTARSSRSFPRGLYRELALCRRPTFRLQRTQSEPLISERTSRAQFPARSLREHFRGCQPKVQYTNSGWSWQQRRLKGQAQS